MMHFGRVSELTPQTQIRLPSLVCGSTVTFINLIATNISMSFTVITKLFRVTCCFFVSDVQIVLTEVHIYIAQPCVRCILHDCMIAIVLWN